MLYNITRYLTKDIQIGKGSIFFLMIPPLKIKLNKIAKVRKIITVYFTSSLSASSTNGFLSVLLLSVTDFDLFRVFFS